MVEAAEQGDVDLDLLSGIRGRRNLNGLSLSIAS